MKDKILKFFSSNIKIKVTGKNVNNFIKRLIKNKININLLKQISYREVELVIDYNDLAKIDKFKSIYDVKITSYYGYLKILKFLKENFFILSFLFLGIVIIYILSNIIFRIDIIHSDKEIIKLLKEELSSYGIKEYSLVKSYDELEKIEEEILKNNKDSLEWLEIIREGTRYVVRIEERIINKEIEDDKNYDIVASKNAVIKEIEAESGEKVKNINTYVSKGSVVISSKVTLPNNEVIQKSAKGKVIGEVWYTVSIEYPYYYNEVMYTGEKKRVLVYTFLNKNFSLFNYPEYKTFKRNIKYIYQGNFIPMSLSYEYHYETNVVNEVYTYDEAIDRAIEFSKKKLLEKYKSIKEILDIKIIHEEDISSKVSLLLFITCDEDITEYVEVEDENEKNISP